jgi:hypothetical protein
MIERYFSHWIKDSDNKWFRINITKTMQYSVYKHNNGYWYFSYTYPFLTFEKIKKVVDDYLLRGGFVLLTEEQYGKYRVLL